jgi:hypothetical protein
MVQGKIETTIVSRDEAMRLSRSGLQGSKLLVWWVSLIMLPTLALVAFLAIAS